jgi:hypothetical protein
LGPARRGSIRARVKVGVSGGSNHEGHELVYLHLPFDSKVLEQLKGKALAVICDAHTTIISPKRRKSGKPPSAEARSIASGSPLNMDMDMDRDMDRALDSSRLSLREAWFDKWT